MAARRTYRVGCDIGGTFTDFVVLDEASGAVHVAKRLTTPADPSRAVLEGLSGLDAALPGYAALTGRLAHASTLVANAVIERKGAVTALLCTAGFRDVLELRRYVRVTTYELFADPPAPLVPRRLRIPIAERTRADGSILRPVDPVEIDVAAGLLHEAGVQSVAICFLHAFANPANEEEAARLLAERLPRLEISLSSAVLPKIKEFERSSTTVVNAYVKPLARRYLSRLEAGVAEVGFSAPLQIMLSNGGIASAETAGAFPVRLIESGPAAGAIVAERLGRLLGLDEVLSFDMGGTTAKICLIRDGALPLTGELEVARSRRFTRSSGFPVATPAVEMIEIGAGGGSIARIGPLGIAEVGPESAGSQPGPACYDLGGTRPTVTDADLALGYLDPANFAGGTMWLDMAAADAALALHVGEPAGHTVSAAAWTVHDVVNEAMASAVRMHVTERGGEPSRPTIVAFGGAGPVHVCNLARKLGIRHVLVPLRAGVLSALGLLIAPPAFEVVRTRRTPLDRLDTGALAAEVEALAAGVRERLAEVDGARAPEFAVALSMGYVGQGYQVEVGVPADGIARLDRATLLARFAEIYRAKYGYFYADIPVELVDLRVSGRIPDPIEAIRPEHPGAGAPADAARRPDRDAWSARLGRFVPFAVLDRDRLAPGMAFAGPALIEEASATTVVDEGAQVTVDRYGSLAITLPEEG